MGMRRKNNEQFASQSEQHEGPHLDNNNAAHERVILPNGAVGYRPIQAYLEVATPQRPQRTAEETMGFTQRIERINLARQGVEGLATSLEEELLAVQAAKVVQDEASRKSKIDQALQDAIRSRSGGAQAVAANLAYQTPMYSEVQSNRTDPETGLTVEERYELIRAADAKNISMEALPAFEADFLRQKAAAKMARRSDSHLSQTQPSVSGVSLYNTAANTTDLQAGYAPIAGQKNPLLFDPTELIKSKNKNKKMHTGSHSRVRRVLGITTIAMTAVGGIGVGVFNAVNSGSGNDASAQLNVTPSELDKDILQNMKPVMTADHLKLGLCLDESTLVKGVVDGEAVAVPTYTGTDGKVKALGEKNADGSIRSVPVTIEAAPVSVAACAPEELRAAIATMKDGVVTINRKDMTPQIMLGAGKGAIPDVEVAPDPAKSLDEATAKKLEDALASDDTKKDLATLAQVQISEAIVGKDSALRTSTLAHIDASMKVNVMKQIADYYAALDQEMPQTRIEFVGEYADLVVAQPPTIAEVVKRTESFKVVGGKVVKLSFSDSVKEEKK